MLEQDRKLILHCAAGVDWKRLSHMFVHLLAEPIHGCQQVSTDSPPSSPMEGSTETSQRPH